MDSPLALATIAVPLAPLLAGFLLIVGGRWSGERMVQGVLVVLGCGGSLAAAITALWLLSRDGTTGSASWVLFRWLDLPGPVPVRASVGVRISELAAMVWLPGVLAACVALLRQLRVDDGNHSGGGRTAAALMLLASTAMLLLSADVLQLVFFWQLTSLIAFALGADHSDNPQAAAAARKAFLVGRVGDIALAFGLLLLWVHFRSPQWVDLFAGAGQLAAESESHGLVLGAVGACLLGGVVARCAQLPLMGWLDDLAASTSPVALVLDLAVLMPAGIFLIARCAGLMQLSDTLQLVTSGLGGFTALLAALSAACAANSRSALAYASASLFGWMLLGLGSGDASGAAGALKLLAAHGLIASLLLTMSTAGANDDSARGRIDGSASAARGSGGAPSGSGRGRWQFAMGAFLLASGYCGQSAVLTVLWDVAKMSAGDTGTAASHGFGHNALFVALLCAAPVAIFLLAFALFRVYFLDAADSAGMDPRTGSGIGVGSGWLGWVLLAAAAAIVGPWSAGGSGIIERMSPRIWPELGAPAAFDPFALGFGISPALLGMVAAWMRFAPSSRRVEKGSPLVAFFVRASRSRYYLDDFFFLSFVLPLRALGQLSRFFDWFLLDGLFVQLPARVATEFARTARPLQNGAVQLYALATLLATAVLLATILWLRG